MYLSLHGYLKFQLSYVHLVYHFYESIVTTFPPQDDKNASNLQKETEARIPLTCVQFSKGAMSGVVFFISIPTPQYEEVLRNRTKNKVSIQEVTSHNVQCEDGVIQSSQENLLEYESPKVAEEIAEDKGDNEDQNESTDSKVSMDKVSIIEQ